MKKIGLIGTIIFLLLSVAEIVAVILTFIEQGFVPYALFNIVLYLCADYYVLFGYKKPHGNLLKYLIFVFVLSLGIKIFMGLNFEMGDFRTYILLEVVAMIFLMYIAGRLHKVQNNIIFFGLLVIIFMTEAIMRLANVNGAVVPNSFAFIYLTFESLIITIMLFGAYFLRFKEHKQAGLEDK